MKKKIFAALLNLAAISGIAIANNDNPEPVVSILPDEPQVVCVGEDFLFSIYYQYTEELVVTGNGRSNQWIWWWDRNDPEVKVTTYTDEILEYNKIVVYTVIATNDYGSDNTSVIYMTLDEPQTCK